MTQLPTDSLHLILFATGQCNLRCTYCYEDFERGAMERAVVGGVQKLLQARIDDGLEHLLIDWFGGEPTVNLPAIRSIHRSLPSDRPGFRSQGRMTTNGLLLDAKLLRELISYGIDWYQISLDGPKSAHDQRRVTAGGKGTWNRIWNNLIAARDSSLEFEIVIRSHFDRGNLETLPRFVELLGSTFGGDDRFTVFLRPVSRLGGPNDSEIPVLDSDGVARLEEFKSLLPHYGLRPHSPGANWCYAASPNSFAVLPDGTLAKCTVALNEVRNQIGRIDRDGRAKVDPGRLVPWLRGLVTADEHFVSCPWSVLRKEPQLVTLSA